MFDSEVEFAGQISLVKIGRLEDPPLLDMDTDAQVDARSSNPKLCCIRQCHKKQAPGVCVNCV